MTEKTLAKDVIEIAKQARKEFKNPATGVPTNEDHLWYQTKVLTDLKEEFCQFKQDNASSHKAIYDKLDGKLTLSTFMWFAGACVTILIFVLGLLFSHVQGA